MSNQEIQSWSLAIGLLIFVGVIALVYLARRLRRHAPSGDRWSNVPTATGRSAPAGAPTATIAAAARRRPASPPPETAHERSRAVRSLVLQAAAERTPAGWTALILTPPPHPETMTWHVHLAPAVALDLRDGRTVPAAPPTATHEWQLTGGRLVAVGDSEIDPAPNDDTVAIRVTGPYLLVVVEEPDAADAGAAARLAARVVTTGGGLPEPRAALDDPRAVQAALREAVELAVASRMTDTPPALGYRPAAWRGHERTWLSIAR